MASSLIVLPSSIFAMSKFTFDGILSNDGELPSMNVQKIAIEISK